MAVLGGFAAGCATPSPGSRSASVEGALQRLAARSARPSGVRGFASLTAWDAKETFKGKLLLIVERPAKVHIQVLSPFDQPISYLATDGDRLDLYLLSEGRYLTGAATADNIAKLLPLRIDPTVFVEALLGGSPLPRPPGAQPRLAWNDEAGVYVLSYDTGGAEAWLKGEDLTVVQAGWLKPGERRGWIVELWDHGADGPESVAFEHRDSGSGFRLRWELREPTGDLPDDTWRIAAPRGVLVESLDAPGDNP